MRPSSGGSSRISKRLRPACDARRDLDRKPGDRHRCRPARGDAGAGPARRRACAREASMAAAGCRAGLWLDRLLAPSDAAGGLGARPDCRWRRMVPAACGPGRRRSRRRGRLGPALRMRRSPSDRVVFAGGRGSRRAPRVGLGQVARLRARSGVQAGRERGLGAHGPAALDLSSALTSERMPDRRNALAGPRARPRRFRAARHASSVCPVGDRPTASPPLTAAWPRRHQARIGAAGAGSQASSVSERLRSGSQRQLPLAAGAPGRSPMPMAGSLRPPRGDRFCAEGARPRSRLGCRRRGVGRAVGRPRFGTLVGRSNGPRRVLAPISPCGWRLRWSPRLASCAAAASAHASGSAVRHRCRRASRKRARPFAAGWPALRSHSTT